MIRFYFDAAMGAHPRARLVTFFILLSIVATFAAPLHAQWTTVRTEVALNSAFFDIDYASANIGYVLGGRDARTSYLYKTANGGTKWTRISGTNVSPTTMYFLNENRGVVSGVASGCGCIAMSRTTDGGSSWTLDTLRAESGDVVPVGSLEEGFLDIDFPDSLTGYAVGSKGMVIKTTDGGLTWRFLKTGNTTDHMLCVSFPDDLHGYIIAKSPSEIHADVLYKTSDGGATWKRVAAPITYSIFYGIHFTSPTIGFLAGYDEVTGDAAIFRTTDGGTTWKRRFARRSDDSFWLVKFADDNVGVAIGFDGLIAVTTNGGVTWAEEYFGDDHALRGISIRDGFAYVISGAGTIRRRALGSSGVEQATPERGGSDDLKLDLSEAIESPPSAPSRR